MRFLSLFFFLFTASLCLAQKQEATSFTGQPLLQIQDSEEVTNKKDSLLLVARNNYDLDSKNLDNIIWLGRRLAYLTRYEEAIKIYTKGIKRHPKSPELYRHRGHRYISTRQLDKAIADFAKAAKLAEGRLIEIEPDGIPNELNQPLSNLHFNIYYHWALAYYLKGDFKKAIELYENCINYSVNPDLLCATIDWLYMSYQRAGESVKAAQILKVIKPDMEIIENDSYYYRLVMYQGLLEPADLLDLENLSETDQLDIVTQGYGVGNWYLYNGDQKKAMEIFKAILKHKNSWPAFGYIAAEAELAR